MASFVEQTGLYLPEVVKAAGEYLFHEIVAGAKFVTGGGANQLRNEFDSKLVQSGNEGVFAVSKLPATAWIDKA